MPNVRTEQKNILAVSYCPDRTDPGYTMCLWASFYFNLDDYELMIMSDCGNFAYDWPSQSESFLHLMCRIGESYLLGKIASETDFQLEESQKSTIENLEDWMFSSQDELDEAKSEINDIDCATEESFYRDAIEILDRYDVTDSFEIVHAVEDYEPGAKYIAHIFAEYIQPFLREQLAEQEAHHAAEQQ